MQITALGHSCLLLAFDAPDSGRVTRILVDPWLSDHATGDAMGRFPRVRFDTAALPEIHAVFLSHAHCDHLDPYTLLRLWAELPTPPVLLLPASLGFLRPVFDDFLGTPRVQVLHPHQPARFRDLELLGFHDVDAAATNEEDVMILVVRNGSERVLVEADARLSLELVAFREFVSGLLCEPGIDSAVYLTTENELTGTMLGRTCTTVDEREEVREAAMDELLESVSQLYLPHDDPSDLWQGDHVLRLVHGQGLAAPHELDARWQRILFPVTVQDRVDAERTLAADAGCRHRVDALTVGSVHTVRGGRITHVEAAPWLRLLDREEDRTFDADLPFFPALPCAPLRGDVRDVDALRDRLLTVLNTRFLPYLHGLRQPPVLHLLSEHGGEYRVRVLVGPTLDDPAWDYLLTFDGAGFVVGPATDDEAQEQYWANDLDDFLAGRCDEFTPFCRSQLPAPAMRLWTCLATPLLNSDLVEKKVRLHFERAAQGLDPGSWVMALSGGEES